MGARDDFERCMAFVERWEGGFVDDPRDPGGATNCGISLRFLRDLGAPAGDVDGDGDVDADDVLALTPTGRRDLYFAHFWARPGLERLGGPPLDVAVFDAGVNMGARRATRILQRTLSGFVSGLIVDGTLGPRTAEAARDLAGACSGSRGTLCAVADRFCLERLADYAAICAANISLTRYLRGWLARVLSLREEMVRAGMRGATA
jgi:lysozyme family protein